MGLYGKWQVAVQTSKNSSPKIIFEHSDKLIAKRYEELHRQGRIK